LIINAFICACALAVPKKKGRALSDPALLFENLIFSSLV
jgi:hypothetical protein